MDGQVQLICTSVEGEGDIANTKSIILSNIFKYFNITQMKVGYCLTLQGFIPFKLDLVVILKLFLCAYIHYMSVKEQ